VELTGKQRRHLRALAHHLEPVVRVGAAGVTAAVIAKTDVELENHELIKVKVGEGSPLSRDEAAPLLAEGTGAAIAQTVGRIIVLYRRRSKKPTIRLPKRGAAPS